MTNHSALAFERNALDLAVGLGASFYDEVDEARADLRAKLLVAMGRIEALRLARSPDEFEAAFDMLATPKLLVELIRLASDPALLLLARQGAARELAGKCLQAHDLISAELRDDVAERWTLLVRHLRSGAESELSQEESADEAVKAIRSLRRPVAEDIAAWFVSVIGLSLASHGREAWDPWMTGLLWTFGRRAVVDAASACGIPWETATDVLTTARDRRLLAQGVDDASSGAAASLLNLHQIARLPSQRKLKFAPIVLDRLQKLGQRDIDIIRENVVAIRDDPQHAGHPSSLSRAKRLALQHVCPHSWVVLYRWQGHDPTHPSGVITVEDLVEMYC